MPFKKNTDETKHSVGRHSLGSEADLRPFDPDVIAKQFSGDQVSDAEPVVDVPVIGQHETTVEDSAAPIDEEAGIAAEDDLEFEEVEPTEGMDPVDVPADPVAPYSRDSYEHRKGSNSRFSKKQKTIITIVAILAILLAIGVGVGLGWYQNMNSNIHVKDSKLSGVLSPTVEENTDPFWVLILGSDSRSAETNGTRSDVIMLARVDAENKKVTLVSIPRDTQVHIDGYGTQKINAAYALGGASLAVQTVSSYANVEISHYAEIYFGGFEDLVDKLGGITVDVPAYCSYKGVTLQPGEQTLNGQQALTLARCRKTYADGDFTRTTCQRLLVQALVQKVVGMDKTQIPDTLQSVSSCFAVDSNWSLTDLANLAISMKGISSADIYSAMAPSDTGMEGGASYTFTYVYQWMLLMERANKGEDPTLDDREKEILGSSDTRYVTMDWTTGIPQYLRDELEAYWNEPEATEGEGEAEEGASEEASTSTGETY